MTNRIERRRLPMQEVRVEPTDGGGMVVRGYAALFNTWSSDLGGFREQILPGAFADVLTNDVRYLVNHGESGNGIPLGRTKAGTLELSEDERGLAYRVDLPDTQFARDLAVSIGRGDIDQNSFGFKVAEDRWSEDQGERTIVRFAELFDVSLVTYPAYRETYATLRDENILQQAGIDTHALAEAIETRNANMIERAIATLRSIRPVEQQPSGGTDRDSAEADRQQRRRARSMRMMYLQNDVTGFPNGGNHDGTRFHSAGN